MRTIFAAVGLLVVLFIVGLLGLSLFQTVRGSESVPVPAPALAAVAAPKPETPMDVSDRWSAIHAGVEADIGSCKDIDWSGYSGDVATLVKAQYNSGLRDMRVTKEACASGVTKHEQLRDAAKALSNLAGNR